MTIDIAIRRDKPARSGLAIFHLTMMFTTALDRVIFSIMKGPRYTSNADDLQDADVLGKP